MKFQAKMTVSNSPKLLDGDVTIVIRVYATWCTGHTTDTVVFRQLHAERPKLISASLHKLSEGTSVLNPYHY